MDVPPSPWEPLWTQSPHTPMDSNSFSTSLVGLPMHHLRPLNHRSSVPWKIDLLQKKLPTYYAKLIL